MSEFEELLEEELELSEEELAILSKALKGELSEEWKQEMIPKRNIVSPAPMSFCQQRLWVLDRLVPGNPFYNSPWAFQLKGRLDISILERSFNEILRRHEVLRTIFTLNTETNEPVQVIQPELKLRMNRINLVGLDPKEQWLEAERLSVVELNKPFDLEKGPLVRVSLLELNEKDHIVLFVLHHIVFDGWSLGIFVQELGTLYSSFMRGEQTPLPPLAIQYADFSVWQRQRMTGDVLEKQLSFWRDLLMGDLPILELPTDKQRPAIPTYKGDYITTNIPEDVSTQINELSQKNECSMFMTFLTALNILFYCYSSQEDILFGSPIANRNRKELEPLIGFFSNTLVFRTDLSGNPTFLDLLARVRQMTLDVYDNQDLPFEKLVEEFQPDRYMSHTPFFQVMIHYGNTKTSSSGDFGELNINSVPLFTQTSKFDLWFNISPQGFGIEYNGDIFQEDTVKRMMKHFNVLLKEITTNPKLRILDISILSDEEIKQLLIEWNNTQCGYSLEFLHHLFEKQVKLTPERVALVGPISKESPSKALENQLKYQPLDTIGSISYQELYKKSLQLSLILKEKGVKGDGVVGVFINRSLDMVIALLGIMRVGGGYLPLDPEYPTERTRFMIKDSDCQWVITGTGLSEQLGELKTSLRKESFETIDMDSLEVLNPETVSSQTNRDLHLSYYNQLCYIIYTSGSTGNPKGAMISHAGICNRLFWMQESFGLTLKDRIMQKTPYSFDVSVWEFFWPLLNGAALVLAIPGGHKDGAYLLELILKEHITTIHFVPSMLQVFLEEDIASIKSLKRVICSGEALSFDLQKRFYLKLVNCSNIELRNLYGPTEASVDVTSWSCNMKHARPIVPIGRPIANTFVCILDRNDNLVPVGVPGELNIAGVQLARGYLNQPELTVKKFCHWQPGALFKKTAPGPRKNFLYNKKFLEVSEPFFKKVLTRRRQRLYKTGDLVRWLPDGNIEFLGRIDFQLKIRGFRIELGEIESKLREHSYVEDSVVLATEKAERENEKKLIAYSILSADYWKSHKEKTDLDISEDLVSNWQDVFDDTYTQESSPVEGIFNISGWNSSYTGEEIAAEEMQEWVDNTVKRILSLKPQHILEIGCGTGLLLFRILPYCKSYMGTDIAKRGLNFIRQQLNRHQEKDVKVELHHQSADDFKNINSHSVDLVIINSVVQYFPGGEYFFKVLEGAINTVREGGSIFIGDVRNLSLLKAFHASVELYKSDVTTVKDQLHRRVVNRIHQENECVIDPSFFLWLKDYFPRIGQVDLLIKQGDGNNELNRFRYDVILRLDTNIADSKVVNIPFLDWEGEDFSLSKLKEILRDKNPEYLGVSGVSNLRIMEDLELVHWLENAAQYSANETIEQFLKKRVNQNENGMNPQEFWQLSEEFPYEIEVKLSEKNWAEKYDVYIKHRSSSLKIQKESNIVGESADLAKQNCAHYTNNPLLGKISSQIVPILRSYLKEKIPEYMVPAFFVFLDTFPLTSNGKLDRRILSLYEPLVSKTQSSQEHEFVNSRNSLDQLLVDVWKEILLINEIGIHDNFFQLGGDSINAIQVVALVKKRGINLSIRHLYQNMTVAELSDYIEAHADELEFSIQSVGESTKMVLDIDQQQIIKYLPKEADIDDIYPLTPFQKHMLNYYLHPPTGQSEVGLFVNQVIIPMQLNPSSISIIDKAFQDFVAVYPYLRTAFFWKHGGTPVQVVYQNIKSEVSSIDLSDLDEIERQEKLNEIIKADHDRGIDRSQPQVYRLTFIRLQSEDYLLLQTSDLMRVDGWSTMIVMKKFYEYIASLVNNNPIELKTNQNYKEYLTWLSHQDETLDAEYWMKMKESCNLPTPLIERAPENLKEDRQQKGFSSQYIYFSKEETAEIDEFLKEHQMLLSTLGSGVWAYLLNHYSGETRVIFGMLFSGRSSALAGIEDMVGQAMNVLPLRIDIKESMGVSEWLKEVWNRLLDLNNFDIHQQDKVRELWEIPKEIPLFESYFVLENFPGSKDSKQKGISARDSLRSSEFKYFAQMEYPLRVELFPLLELRLTLQYYRSYFTDHSIEIMLQDFRNLMLGIIRHPYLKVKELKKLL